MPNNSPKSCFTDSFSLKIIMLTTVDNTTTPPFAIKRHTHQSTCRPVRSGYRTRVLVLICNFSVGRTAVIFRLYDAIVLHLFFQRLAFQVFQKSIWPGSFRTNCFRQRCACAHAFSDPSVCIFTHTHTVGNCFKSKYFVFFHFSALLSDNGMIIITQKTIKWQGRIAPAIVFMPHPAYAQ